MTSLRQAFGNWKKSTMGRYSYHLMLDRQKYLCPSCMKPLINGKKQIHHLISLKEIENQPWEENKKIFWATYDKNLVILCEKCNKKQGSKLDSRFSDCILTEFLEICDR